MWNSKFFLLLNVVSFLFNKQAVDVSRIESKESKEEKGEEEVKAGQPHNDE
jgi:hypothetical protein